MYWLLLKIKRLFRQRNFAILLCFQRTRRLVNTLAKMYFRMLFDKKVDQLTVAYRRFNNSEKQKALCKSMIFLPN